MNEIKHNLYTSGVLSFVLQSFISFYLSIENSILDVTSIYMFILILWLMVGYSLNLRLTNKDITSTIAISIYTLLCVNIMIDNSWLSYTNLMPFSNIWHHDSLFHLAIIISITNEGFASIAQHGLIPTDYHTLSHYIDAIIILLTKNTPYDVYTLMFYAKSVFVILSILTYISFSSRDKLDFFLKSIVFLPLVIQDGHITGSFGLSWTIPFMLIAVHFSSTCLKQSSAVKTWQYFLIALFIALLTYGKISAAIAFVSIICTMLFFKEYRNYKFYIFSFIVICFFLYTILKYNATDIHNGIVQFPQWIEFYSLVEKYTYTPELVSCIIFILFFNTYLLFRSLTKWRLSIVVSIVAFLFIVPIIYTYSTQRKSDIFYFFLSGYHVTLLIFINDLPKLNEKKITSVVACGMLIFMVFLVPTPFNKGSEYIKKSLTSNSEKSYIDKKDTPQYIFRNDYRNFTKVNSINATDSLLFVPMNVFEDDDFFISKSTWSRSLYIYSLLETPLINGVIKQQDFYGFSPYRQDSLVLNKEGFDYKQVCQIYKKNILTINRLRGKDKFDLYRCR